MQNRRLIRRLNLHFAALWGLFWASSACLWSFRTVFLLYHGFTNSQIGLVSSLALLLPIAAQPLLSSLSARCSFMTNRNLSIALTILSMVCCVGIWLWGYATVYAVLLVIIGVALTMVPPYFNALNMDFVMRGMDLNFGASRSCGSVAYSLTSLVMGAALERFAPTLILPVFLAISAALLLALFLFRYPLPPLAETAEKAASTPLSNVALLRRYPRFALMLAACFLLIGSQVTLGTYMIQIAGKVGGGESVTGTAYFLAALSELPAMLLFARVRRKLSLRALMMGSTVFFVIRCVGFLLAGSIPMLYASCLLQFFAYAVMALSTVYYVAEELDAANQAKGQTLIYILPSGVGAAFGALVGGWLLDISGVNAMLLFCTLCAVVGAVIMVPTLFGRRKA